MKTRFKNIAISVMKTSKYFHKSGGQNKNSISVRH